MKIKIAHIYGIDLSEAEKNLNDRIKKEKILRHDIISVVPIKTGGTQIHISFSYWIDN